MSIDTAAVAEFSSTAFDSADTADMAVELYGKPTTWLWTFAGPGHPQSVALADRMSRDRLREDREKEQSRINGRKWKASDETPDELRQRNIGWIVDRLIGWSPVKIDGEMLPFSPEAATKFLADPRKSDLLRQSLEFLSDDASFTKRSATT